MMSFPFGQFLDVELDADPLILKRHFSPSR